MQTSFGFQEVLEVIHNSFAAIGDGDFELRGHDINVIQMYFKSMLVSYLILLVTLVSLVC
jgi:hypothetical protein